MAQLVEQNAPKPQVAGSRPRYRLYIFFLHFTGSTTFSSIKSNESTGREFESQYKLCCLIFYSKNDIKIQSLQTSKTTPSMSVLSHTEAARTSDVPRLVYPFNRWKLQISDSLILWMRPFLEKPDDQLSPLTIPFPPKL